MSFEGGAFGQFPFGQSPFGGGPDSPVTVTVTSVAHATGPFLTFNYSVTNTDGFAQQQIRIQLIQNSTGLAVFDTGWLVNTLTSGSSSSFTVDLIDQHIPLNTTGNAYSIAVFSTPSQDDPNVTLWIGRGVSTSFDIDWGSPSLVWIREPPSIVDVDEGTQASVDIAWGFFDPGGFGEGFWEVTLTSPDGTQIYYDSTLMSGSDTSTTIPGINSNTSYLITVNALNTNGVPATPLTVEFSTGHPIVVSAVTGAFLQRWLGIIGYELDTNRSLLEALRYVNDPLRCPGNLLPALSQELGVNAPGQIVEGMTQIRKLLSGIVHQYKIKGTIPGIAGICTGITGWASTVDISSNLMLTSSPLYLSGATGTAQSYVVSGAGEDAFPASPVSTTIIPSANYPAAWPTALNTLTDAITATIYTGGGTTGALTTSTWITNPASSGIRSPLNNITIPAGSVQGYGIPVANLSTVAFSFYMWVAGLGGAPSVTPSIKFYDNTGTLISTWTAGSSTSITISTHSVPHWILVSGSAISVPAGSLWAVLTVTPTSALTLTAGTSTAIIAAPFFGAAAYTNYQQPLTLNISLLADRVNYIPNPSFEGLEVPGSTPPVAGGTLFGWSADSNCILSLTNSVSYPVPSVPRQGTWSCQVTTVTLGNMTVLSSLMPINPEFLYTASMYANSAAASREIILSILFYDASATLLQVINGLPVFELVGEWVRPYAQVNPGIVINPEVTQARLRLEWLNCGASEVHYIDAALFEPAWALRPYFDGGLYETASPPLVAPDYSWAGVANKLVNSGSTVSVQVGPSYYYNNYAKKLTRLGEVLSGAGPSVAGQISPLSITGFLPAGAAYNLVTPTSI